ncbi:C4-dicarboxylate ABC transporter [Oleiphilus sp. HI0009]|nr:MULTISPECIES: TRAP transporter large permease subunit [unclassified Oleiphilus]KZX73468.1 C4-dicarboxylate ABC transporter [Oleiphilus sp. HI0009]KZY64499.1 C4-dicarboxylate ABC transporter [Oleiphilus sp. HI0066]KZY71655.1 C4-dicarboxylate ABC transporter [Oleiphilus sp. HI0067]KZZ57789.1 C4-dicarboxylate ABC transporter [Oleiphilus sp. HI0125]
MVSNTLKSRSPIEWLSSLPACILLLMVVIFSTSSDVHNQILQVGEHYWEGYYKLRTDPELPSCDAQLDVEAAVQERLAESAEEDDFGLFDAEPADPELIRQSIINSKADCVAAFESYEETKQRITPALETFRAVELFVSEVIAVGIMSQKFILVGLILLCATTATFTRHHIAMRPVMSRLDHYVASTAQLAANGLLLASAVAFRDLAHSDGSKITADVAFIHELWVYGFGVLTIMSAINIFRPAADLTPGGNIGRAGLAIPLYATMTIIAAAFFFFGLGEGNKPNPAALGIHLDKLLDLSDMFLNVGLYVWIGMMLKQTRFASLVLSLFKPWKLPPELLVVLVVILAAIPTAYTGGSGIFVIAAGAVIYHELRAAGTRRQLALAATAMSGSMGVVLRPCLLVVVIAFMNREVTTDQLFGWGVYVFMLSAVMFGFFALTLNRQSKFELASPGQAFPEMLQAFRPLIPYIILSVAVVLFYRYAVNVRLDEFSAARILPVMMLVILIYEHVTKKEAVSEDGKTKIPHKGIETNIRTATNQTTAEIGALLLLIGCTICLGGTIERSGIVETFPAEFSSVWAAMGLLVCVLIVMGMIMEPFGAVILVSQTIAPIAYSAGIDPIHFWMLTLVAFELGYLSPPVALNHLLARQVVGEKEALAAVLTEGTFYQRYEKILLPLITMGTVLLIVAFTPLFYQMMS